MPTQPLAPGHPKWELALEAYQAIKVQGTSRGAWARERGLAPETVRNWLKRVREYNARDPATQMAMDAAQSGMVPKLTWSKQQADGTILHSSLFVHGQEDAEPQEDVLKRVIEHIKPAPMVNRPPVTSESLHNIAPTFDKHLALRVDSYGLERALERIHEGFRDVLERAPRAASLTCLDGGDITHQNDDTNMTPRGKHPLMVDLSYDDAVTAAINLADWKIQTGLEYSDHVEYVALIGNHDPNTAKTIQRVLEARYDGNARVTVYTKSKVMWAREVGANLFLSHHGHAKKNAIVKAFPEMVRRYRKAWGRARYCELITGHLHHIAEIDTELGFWRRVRPVCPMSQYDDEEFYGGLSEMVCTTYALTGFVKNEVSHVFAPETHEQYEAA